MPHHRRDRGPDYPQIYFGFLVWREIGRVISAILGGILLFVYFVIATIWPDNAPIILADMMVCVAVVGAICVLYLFFAVLFRLFVPRRPASMFEWVPPGAIANPKGDWFDDRKRPLWRREGDQWVPIIYKD
jgi:hypothetical protein